MYEQDQILAVLPGESVSNCSLETSASLIRQWVAPSVRSLQFLQKHNDFDVVLLLCADGPRYVLKQQTGKAKRLNQNFYYDHLFANLVFAATLRHRGKAQAVYCDVVRHFVERGCAHAPLMLTNTAFSEVVRDVLQQPQVGALRSKLITQATENNEWVVMSHDATFKILFSCIGQTPMAQREGEAHTLHSFLGKTGALAGLSVQPKESQARFLLLNKVILRIERFICERTVSHNDNNSYARVCVDVQISCM